ncbi:unnamed protein product [Cyprideis torosa]|uniref:Transporter n=1 Tax=Cyprideis torosa TaxID=163714 RepID=A0A7R8ZLP4_9CRUS|nr:unnamed protein product [Cyprideis torosa]CAG0887151.1 unnamed protein product [Cyprideis torosa]
MSIKSDVDLTSIEEEEDEEIEDEEDVASEEEVEEKGEVKGEKEDEDTESEEQVEDEGDQEEEGEERGEKDESESEEDAEDEEEEEESEAEDDETDNDNDETDDEETDDEKEQKNAALAQNHQIPEGQLAKRQEQVGKPDLVITNFETPKHSSEPSPKTVQIEAPDIPDVVVDPHKKTSFGVLEKNNDSPVQHVQWTIGDAEIPGHTRETKATKMPHVPSFVLEDSRGSLVLSKSQLPTAPDTHGAGERGQWGNQLDFLFSCISFAVGLGNIWRFPYYCFKNGGGAFLIPYFIAMIFCGIPIFFLEIAMGQYFALSNVRVLGKLAPIMKGCGLSAQVMVGFVNTYYTVIAAWGIMYLVQSFTALPDLPWSECTGADWETDNCIDATNSTNAENGTYVVVEFWESLENVDLSVIICSCFKKLMMSVDLALNRNRVLDISDGLEHPEAMRWELLGYLALAWFITWAIIWKGLHNSGKIVWVTATFPYLVLFILFGRAVTLDGAKDGLKFYITPDFDLLLTPDPWMDAGSQVFYSYGLAIGTLFALGSYNDFHHNCGSGPGLAFLTYPEVVASIGGAPFWSILFFVMFLVSWPTKLKIAFIMTMKASPPLLMQTLGIDSAFCTVEGFITSMVDLWPDILLKKRKLFTAGVCFFFFLTGIPQVTNVSKTFIIMSDIMNGNILLGGIYLFTLIDQYGAAGIALMLTALSQSIVFAWIFGVDRVYDCIEEMLDKRPHWLWGICWKFIGPIFMIVRIKKVHELKMSSTMSLCISFILSLQFIAVFFFVQYEPVTYDSTRHGHYEYPWWGIMICWLMAGSSVICIPGYFIYYLIKSDLPLKEVCAAVARGIRPSAIACSTIRSLDFLFKGIETRLHDKAHHRKKQTTQGSGYLQTDLPRGLLLSER